MCIRDSSYVFGFEESYGYLTGSYVRDKDGVDGAYMICEMFSYYATRGISLLDKLDELYKTYGYCLNTLHSYESVSYTHLDVYKRQVPALMRRVTMQLPARCWYA